MPNLFLRLGENKDEEMEREVGFIAVGVEPIKTTAISVVFFVYTNVILVTK
jgi:hypothetical protein